MFRFHCARRRARRTETRGQCRKASSDAGSDVSAAISSVPGLERLQRAVDSCGAVKFNFWDLFFHFSLTFIEHVVWRSVFFGNVTFVSFRPA